MGLFYLVLFGWLKYLNTINVFWARDLISADA